MDLKTWLARLERLEDAAQPDSGAVQTWLTGIPTPDLERLVDLAKRTQAGELFDDDDIAFYNAMAASAPAGFIQTTGE